MVIFELFSKVGSIKKSDKGIIASTDKPARKPSINTKKNSKKKPLLKLINNSLNIKKDELLLF